MTFDIGECFLGNAEKHGALGAAKRLDPGKGRQLDFDSFSLRQALAIGMERRDQSDVIQYCRPQFAGELVHRFRRI